MDATGAENNTTILAIEPSTLEQGLIWVGSDDGLVHITRDGGKTWNKVSGNITGMPAESWVAQIRASKHRAGEAFVVVNNYRNFDFKPYLFRTKDYGQTWTQLVNETSVFGYTLSLVQDPVEPRLLFLGTEHGLYVSIDEGQSWTLWTNGYPQVSTMDLAIQPREQDLIMGTFGRAAWVLDDIRPLRELATKGNGILNESIHVFDPPDAYQASNQQATGTRFAGNAIYIGENRKRGAMLTYSVYKKKEVEEEVDEEVDEDTRKGKKSKAKKDAKPVSEVKKDEDSKKPKADSVTVSIYNAENILIRTLKQAYKENGVQRMYWHMDEKGVRRPARKEPKKNASEPGGVDVLPGSYKIVMAYDGKKDSTNIKVIYDPRIDMPMSTLKAKYDAFKIIEGQTEVAANAMSALRKSDQIIDDILKQLKGREGEDYDSLKKLSKSVKDSVKVLVDALLGPESDKQGIVRSPDPTVMSYIRQSQMYLGSSLSMPGATENQLMENAKGKLTPWLNKVNAFYTSTWSDYKQHVAAVDLSPFKDIPKFELE